MNIFPLTEHEQTQLNLEGKAFKRLAHDAVDQMLDRNPAQGECSGTGLTIDELLGTSDGPFRVHS
jgi:hypothetical protein